MRSGSAPLLLRRLFELKREPSEGQGMFIAPPRRRRSHLVLRPAPVRVVIPANDPCLTPRPGFHPTACSACFVTSLKNIE